MPSAVEVVDLPKSSSATLRLVQASEAEMIESSTMGATSWRGPLNVGSYLRREAHLRNQVLTRNGGITYWVLVDTADFYARFGWKVYPSKHIDLYAKSIYDRGDDLPTASMLAAVDLEELCRVDEAMLRSDMATSTPPDSCIRVSLLPDVATMQWHHAREDFLAQELLGRRPLCKGALARIADGKRAWCIWTRKFGANRDDNVLNILRLVVEGETNVVRQTVAATGNGDLNTSDQATVAAIAAILRAALFEASGWEMASVQLWNPSPLSVMAAKIVDPSAKVVDRYHESLASLRWHGPTPLEGTEIDWICNEKYAWC
ncbi:MAG: hypothetical protein Q9201_001822 [Fulgogasparrea decipioides]